MSKKWFIVAVIFFVLIMVSAFYFHFWGQAEVRNGQNYGPTPMEMAKQRAQQRVGNSEDYRSLSRTVVYKNSTSLFTYIKYLFLLTILSLIVLYILGYRKIPNFLIGRIPRKIRIVIGVIIGILVLMVLGSIGGFLTSISNGISFITGNRMNTKSVVAGDNNNTKQSKDHSEKVVASHQALQQKMQSSQVDNNLTQSQSKLTVSGLEKGSKKFITKKTHQDNSVERLDATPKNNLTESNQTAMKYSDSAASNRVTPVIERGMVRVPLVGLNSVNSIGKLSNLIKHIVRSQIPGKVAKILVEEGQYVKKGQPVVMLDVSGYKENLDNARVELRKVRLDYSKIMKNYDSVNSKRIWQLQNKMKELQAMILANEAYIRQSTVRAQQTGMITSIKTDKGNFIEPNKPLMFISDPVSLEVTYLVPATYYKNIKINSVVYLTLRKGSPYGYVAVVNYISSDVDMETNMLIVQATIKNHSALLKGGMVVHVLQTIKQ